VLLGAPCQLPDRRHAPQDLLAAFAQRGVRLARKHAREIIGERADVLRDRHVVVVEHDEHVHVQWPAVIQGLERLAGAHRAIADHRHDAALYPGSRTAASAMPSAALIDVLEWPTPNVSYSLSKRLGNGARPPLCLMVCSRSRRPGQHLVRIGLVTDVPDEAVVRRVEDVVQRDREFDRAEPAAKWPPIWLTVCTRNSRTLPPAPVPRASGGAGRPGSRSGTAAGTCSVDVIRFILHPPANGPFGYRPGSAASRTMRQAGPWPSHASAAGLQRSDAAHGRGPCAAGSPATAG
jgi:hypothetical protein